MHNIAKILMAVCEDAVPLWQAWDGDMARLPEFAGRLAVAASHWDLADDAQYTTLTNLVWCLDRLSPPGDPALFISYLGGAIRQSFAIVDHAAPADSAMVKRAVYAWGRRLPPLERACLPALAVSDAASARTYAEAMAAWAETCPIEDAASLFQWPEMAGYHKAESFGVLVSEFVKRVDGAEGRLRTLASAGLTIADDLLARCHVPIRTERDNLEFSRRAGLLDDLTGQVIRDAAALSVEPDGTKPPERDQSQHWLRAVLEAMPIPALTGLFHRLDALKRQPEAMSYMPDAHELAMRLWIAQQNAQTWERLHGALDDLEGYERHMAIERLSEAAPQDRLDIWTEIIQRGPYRVPAFNCFCRWLAADDRRRFLSYTSVSSLSAGDEIEMAESAFRSYLHLATQHDRDALWREYEFLPFWQALLLDRFLHAPDTLKPSAVLYGVASVEGDFRLEDRLNLRRV